MRNIRRRIARVRARKIILWAGVNDLRAGRSPEAIAADVRAMVVARPVAMVVTVNPVGKRLAHLNAPIRRLNGMLAQLCRARCRVVDTWAMLESGGALRDGLSRDGLHLTAEGYAAIRPLFSSVSNVSR